jgi:eukaryotic-like serine/threonine-protein kinase
MALAAGTRLGSYEIIDALGAGGMGEVYRARDTKLKRTVAIKVLPEAFSRDPDRLARFEREAELLATLNHTNVAAIYGLEESNGLRALVLELVEGPTLADRLLTGPIPLEEALPIARQIAEAMEAAHTRGIIHRDLKPANIKLRPDGTVKVLDFGLAKVFDTAPTDDLTQSAHLLSPAPTIAGVVLGTAAYMSPEQARGKAVDKRTDVWAFGCVFFEMLTGRRPFEGETVTDVIAAIISNEPDWRALPAGTPASVRSLIARCLRKDPAQRLRDIADGRFQIEETLSDPGSPAAASVPARRTRERAAWIAALLLMGATLLLVPRPSNNTSSVGPITFSVYPAEKTAFSATVNTTVNVPSFALAPDGKTIAFSAQIPGAKPTLWLRSIDRIGARELAGTDDAQDPFWSPDSRWIGFFADGKLKKIPSDGGPVQVITQTTTDFRGGSWSPEGRILFAGGAGPLRSVNADGGTPAPATTIDESQEEGRHQYPYFLPDGRHFLYFIIGRRQDRNGVYVGSLDGRTKKLLVSRSTSAIYAPPGYLLFADEETLFGQAFDAERLELTGQPFAVAEHCGRNTAFMSAVSASRTGIVAYAGIIPRTGRLGWIDRTGTALASIGAPDGDYTDFRLSPDESQLAASLFDAKSNAIEIWLTDLARRSAFRWAPAGLLTASALWSPDGTRVTFRSNRNGIVEFFERSAAGGGTDRPVLSGKTSLAAQLPPLNLIPTDWSPDGRRIMFSAPTPDHDLWWVPIGEEGKAAKFIASRGEQIHGNFSPDGRLVAYTSDESGQFEVYVETIPRSDRKWPISTSGGYEPRWRGDGRELYYLSSDRKLMAVAVSPGPSFGLPTPLFQTHVPVGVRANRTHYEPSRDGRRFLFNTVLDAPAPPINVIVNWTKILNPQ